MNRIPFGVSRLDRIIGGGAPPGSLVLLAGEAGAGAREFLYTSTTMNALADADPDAFDLHYGEVSATAEPPDEIHYVSFTAGEDELRTEIEYTIDADLAEPASDAVEFADFSTEFFQLSPIPRDWYAGKRRSITDLSDRDERRGVLESLGDYLTEHAAGNLVLIDSLTDLIHLSNEQLDWSDITMLLAGLQKASRQWDGLILVLVNRESLTDTKLGALMASADGTLAFEWEAGGNERARTMFVKEFRGVLPQIEEENIVRFETEIHEAGFDVSDVRKIR
jgi:archaellum biogenesis ATPase FlaH